MLAGALILAAALVAGGLGARDVGDGDSRICCQERERPSEELGESVRGAPIVARAWGDHGARRRVLVVGSIHGDETQGHRIVSRLTGRRASRLKEVELWTVETLNPDGVAANTRGNAHSGRPLRVAEVRRHAGAVAAIAPPG